MKTIDMRPRAERAALLEAYYEAERQKAMTRILQGPVEIQVVLRARDRSFQIIVDHWDEADEIIERAASFGLIENDETRFLPWEIDHLECTSPHREKKTVRHYRGDIFIADLPKHRLF
jgi:hypothetical protein